MIGSLFSGIGGLELGLEKAGLGPVAWQVEIDPWNRAVLAAHWPEAERFSDVRGVGREQLRRVDVLCGGFPCQDVSVAGKGAGLAGARSGLWREYLRIIGEIRPLAVVVENVAALATRGLDRVVADLVGAGYRVEGRIIAAADVGAPHQRDRLFLVAVLRTLADGGSVGREEQRAPHDDDGAEPRGDVADGRGPEVADSDRERLRQFQQRVAGRRQGGLRDGGKGEPVDDGATRRGHAQPRMGGGAHGIPGWVDRWPAGPGDAPALWEPPRSVTGRSPTSARRRAALGNAVVPHVAELVGQRVMTLLGA